MRFVNPIPFVEDIGRSKAFYQERLGLRIIEDFGNFVMFETGFAIHEGQSLEQTIWRQVSEGGRGLRAKEPAALFRTRRSRLDFSGNFAACRVDTSD